MAKADWTPEIFERAKTLWLDGKSGSEVAALIKHEFGHEFTRNAIVGKMHRTGNARPDERPHQNISRAASRIRARQTPPARPKPKPAPAIKAAPSLRLSILDLDRNQCRFATHDAPDGHHGFCGHKTAESSSYCPAHKAVTIDAKRTAEQRRRKKRRDDPDLTALRTAQRNAGLMRVFG